MTIEQKTNAILGATAGIILAEFFTWIFPIGPLPIYAFVNHEPTTTIALLCTVPEVVGGVIGTIVGAAHGRSSITK